MKDKLREFSAKIIHDGESMPMLEIGKDIYRLQKFNDGKWMALEDDELLAILDAEEGGYWPDGSDAPIRDYTPAQVPAGPTSDDFGSWCNILTHTWMYVQEGYKSAAWLGVEQIEKEMREWQRKLAASPKVPPNLAAIREVIASIDLRAETHLDPQCKTWADKLAHAIGDKP